MVGYSAVKSSNGVVKRCGARVRCGKILYGFSVVVLCTVEWCGRAR